MEQFPKKIPGEGPEYESMRSVEIHKVSDQCLAKMINWTFIASIVGSSAYVAKEVHDSIEEEEAYQVYLQETLNAEELRKYEDLRSRLVAVVGEEVMEGIELGDKTAFLHSDMPDHEPHYDGFNDSEGELFTLPLGDLPEYSFTERYNMYPEHWINGEISRVMFMERPASKKDITLGGHEYHPDIDKGVTFVYDFTDKVHEYEILPQTFYEYMDLTFAHESGHANDWNLKSTLNLLERAEMLSAVLERMESSDAYSDGGLAGGQDYWRSKEDGTPKGKHDAAKEYWALICEEYFTNPTQFFSDHLADFELVQSIVEKTDSQFDIFDPERGAYDQHTGQVREKWEDLVSQRKTERGGGGGMTAR